MDAFTLRFRALTDRLRGSLLALPILMLIGAIALLAGIGWIDSKVPDDDWPAVFQIAPSHAISLLSTIAGATITTAGVVFSLLVVSLQLASGQFSPRVLRGFYRDRLGQVVIGLLMGTFTYCVLALPAIDDQAAHAPSLVVGVAMALGLASIVGIVAYLDRISRRQYVGNITDRIGGETLELVRALPVAPAGDPTPTSTPRAEPAASGFVVTATADGWVQQISHRVVLDAVAPGSTVRLETRVGAFVLRGAPLAIVWPPPTDPAAVTEQIEDGVIVGPARTMQQDIDFGLRQLNDIALRALSPAVNDPTTAIEALMRVASIMRPLLLAELPAQHTERAGKTLLTPWDIDHNEYIRHAFDQVRQAAAHQSSVAMALVRTLRMLIDVSAAHGHHRHVPALQDEIELTLAGCAAAGLLPADLAAIRTAATTPQLVS